MNISNLIGPLAVFCATGIAHGGLTFNVNTDIPTGNPVGITSIGMVSGLAGDGTVSDITVGLNLSGGYNGNLYAYLEAPDGTTATLLDRPGVTSLNPFGYGGSGLNVTFSDAAGESLQNTPETPGSVTTGNYEPAVSFSTLNSLIGNGAWTLFIADDVAGGGQAVLNSWSLDISTTTAEVPEPNQLSAIVLLSLALAGVEAARWRAGRYVKEE